MEIKDIAPVVLFIATIVGWVGSFFKAKGMDEVQQKQWDEKLKDLNHVDEKQWIEIDASKAWHNRHEAESAQRRLELELKIATLAGAVGKIDGRLESIEKKLDDLIQEMKHHG